MKEPKIRFKEFKGEWESPSIAEVFELRNGYTPSKAIEAFWKGGTIPCLTAAITMKFPGCGLLLS